MKINEIVKFQTEDGEVHETLQAAQKHVKREGLISYLLSNTDIDDRYTAGDVIDALHRRFTITESEQS